MLSIFAISLAACVTINWAYWMCFTRVRRNLDGFSRNLSNKLIRCRLGPLSQNLSYLLACLLTSLIMKFPNWKIWCSVTQTNGPISGILGKSAALILAVLTFTASTTANAVRDREQGGKYFGVPLSTYLISKSYISSILWTPAYKIFALIVFLFPFLSGLIPTQEQGISFFKLRIPHPLGTSIWLSCLIIVGMTLLLNMLSLFRQTFIHLRQPFLLKINIREDLRKEADNRIRALFVGGSEQARENSKELHIEFIKFMSSLSDDDERREYYQETIGSSKIRNRVNDNLSVLNDEFRETNSICHSFKTYLLQAASRLHLPTFRKSVEDKLRSTQSILQGRHEALVESLDSPDTQVLQTKLLKQMLLDSTQVDNHVTQITEDQKIDILNNCGIIRQSAQLPDGRPFTTVEICPRPKRGQKDDSPSVIVITAMTYRELAKTIRNSFPLKDPLSDRYSIESLSDIVSTANRIQHEQTRRYALCSLIDALVDSLIINRHPNEQIPASELAALVPGLKDYLNTRPYRQHEGVLDSPHSIAVSIALDSIKRQLKPVDALDPKAYWELLRYVPKEEVVAALLYMLLHTYRSNHKVSSTMLLPFVSALRDHYGVSEENKDRFYNATLTILDESSCVSHTLNKSGLKWLFETLDEPITVELYRALKSSTDDRFIYINFTNLVLWRVLVGRRLYYGGRFIDDKQNPLEECDIDEAKSLAENAADILYATELKNDAYAIRASLSPQELPKQRRFKVLHKNIAASRIISSITKRF